MRIVKTCVPNPNERISKLTVNAVVLSMALLGLQWLHFLKNRNLSYGLEEMCAQNSTRLVSWCVDYFSFLAKVLRSSFFRDRLLDHEKRALDKPRPETEQEAGRDRVESSLLSSGEFGEPLSFFNSPLLYSIVINLSKGAVMCYFTNQMKEAIFLRWVSSRPCLDRLSVWHFFYRKSKEEESAGMQRSWREKKDKYNRKSYFIWNGLSAPSGQAINTFLLHLYKPVGLQDFVTLNALNTIRTFFVLRILYSSISLQMFNFMNVVTYSV